MHRLSAGDTSSSCAPSFWRFVAAAGAGSIAAGGAGWLITRAVKDPHAREIAVFGTRVVAFWTIAGVTWYALGRRAAT